tara:strand:+ start:231 stop:578 length:348 start_codon:yes stop_codon:yes gene_type:complete
MDELRFLKVNSLIKQEMSRIIESEINDPRISTMVTVQKIKSSRDFSVIRVYVSMLADSEDSKLVLRGLKSSQGYARKLLQKSIKNIRFGKLIFEYDNSPEEVLKISDIIDSANEK